MIPPPRRLGPESRGSGEGVPGHSFLLPLLRHLHQLRSSSAMTDADSWDTCVLGYMCTRSILLAKDSPSPSPLNRPVEQAGGEAVWRGSASRRQPGAEAQSGFPIRGLPCSLGAPGPRVPSSPSLLHHLGIKCPFLRKGAESWSAVQEDGRSLCLTFLMFHTL